MSDDLADDRWTVRGVPKAYRDKAAEAAARRKVAVGVLVCQALDREIQAERQPLEIMRPAAAEAADKLADWSDTLSDGRTLAKIERAIAAAVALAGEPNVPAAFRRRANRLLRESLPPSAPRTPPAVTPSLLQATNGADRDAAHRD